MVGSFRSVAGAVGLALTFSLAAVPAPVAAAEGVPSEAEIQDEGRLVTDTEGNALMVGASEYFGSVPHFRYRHAEGHWSREYDLPGVSFATEVRAASGRPHMPVVLFRPNAGLDVTIRRPDATWTRPYDVTLGMDGAPTGADVATNPAGDYAVSWIQRVGGSSELIGKTYVAIKLRGDRWRTYAVGGRTATRHGTKVGLDAYGNVTVARVVISTGETQRRMLLRTRPAGQRWGIQRQVSGADEDIDDFALIVERTGRQTVGLVEDTESPTRARVLRQATLGGPLTQVWTGPNLPVMAADGGRLRIAWHTTGTVEEPPVITTQAFNPAPGEPVPIADIHAYLFDVAIDRYGNGALVLEDVVREGTDAFAIPVTAQGVGAAVMLTGKRMGILDVQVALGAGRTYFAGVNFYEQLPAGYLGYLNAFRLQRP